MCSLISTAEKHSLETSWASQVVLVVKNPPAKEGDKRDAGLIPGTGRSLEDGRTTHSSIPAWELSWIKEPGGLQPGGH